MGTPTTRLHPPVKPVTSLRSPSFKHFMLETHGFGDKINKMFYIYYIYIYLKNILFSNDYNNSSFIKKCNII
jgi:hypothetical protein